MWDESKLKYDKNRRLDISFGEEFSQRSGKTEVYSYSNMSQDKRLIQLAGIIIKESIKKEASDIKVYRYDANNAFVELRIGGRMVKTRRIDVRAVEGLIQAFKRMAGMDVSENTAKNTGDGRISLEVDGTMYNLRVNSIPSIYNETLSIRIIKSDDSFNNLEYLGMPDFVLGRFRKVINQSEGMIVLSGSTGSGKSLSDDTLIPLSDGGFKQLGSIERGDYVLNKMGEPVEVVGVYPQDKQKMYKVVFSDNSIVYASHDHLWEIELEDEEGYLSKVMDTTKIKDMIRNKNVYIGNIYQPINKGNSTYDIKDYRLIGAKVSKSYLNGEYKDGLRYDTINKLSAEDRVNLLEGILSNFEKEGNIYKIPEKGESFIKGFRSLVSGLGYSLLYDKRGYTFSFTGEEYKSRKIMCIEEVYDEESTCLEVDDKDSLFLATESYIPTHNTTTMYTALKEIIRTTRGVKNIHTIEDPVESLIPGTVQNEVNEVDGFTFAQGIRGLLRQNPDIILIGEIRDDKSAETALRASTSGHLLFTTVHTNNALAVPMVMQQYGLKKNDISSALQMVINQRLVGRLCDNCKKISSVNTEDMRYLGELGIDGTSVIRVARRDKEGCSECDYTGYKGKLLVVEMMDADRNFDEILNKSDNDYELKQNLQASERKSYYSKEEDVERHIKNLVMDFETAQEVIR